MACWEYCCFGRNTTMKECEQSTYNFDYWSTDEVCNLPDSLNKFVYEDYDKAVLRPVWKSGIYTNLQNQRMGLFGQLLFATIEDFRRNFTSSPPLELNNKTETVGLFSNGSDSICNFDDHGLVYRPEYNRWSHAIATPFVVLTLVVYVSSPNFRNVHGLSLVCLLLNIAACNILTVIAYWTEYTNLKFCNTISYLLFWSYKGKELWMFTIAFDLCRHFRTRIMAQRMSRPFKRVLAYSIFAWGSSAFVTLLLSIRQLCSVNGQLNCCANKRNCCLNQLFHWEILTHYDYIESVFAALNVMFLVLTIIKIRRTEQDIEENMGASNDRNVSGDPQGNQNNVENFCKYFRLAVLMDLTWILSKVCHLIQESEAVHRQLYRDIAWLVDIALQSSRGVVIFFVFALNRRTRNAFWTRIKMICRRSNNTTTECRKYIYSHSTVTQRHLLKSNEPLSSI